MTARAIALLLAGLLAVLAGASAPGAEGRAKRSPPRLKAFASCAKLIGYARRHVPPPPRATRPPPPPPRPAPPISGGEDGAAAPVSGGEGDSGGGSSTTNVQEAGVDEPDVVKTDGALVYALVNGTLHVADAASPSPRRLGSVRIGGFDGELLLHGERVLALGEDQHGARLTEVSVADPAHPRVLRTLAVDGAYLSARQHGRTARVVIGSTPRAMQLPGLPVAGVTALTPRALRGRRAGWIPSAVLRNRRTGSRRRRALVACDDVRHGRRFTGAELLTVLTIDLERGLPAVDADAVMAGGQTVYASTGNVYVGAAGGAAPDSTALHRFAATAAGQTEYRGSGTVPGRLLNQFSLSEYGGVLRAATTSSSGRRSESHVSTLELGGGRLDTLGRVSGLGPTERIYAVRFIEDRGYVVTFRQTDPLYTLDLTDPARPRVRGELKILGYSAYLHPVGEHLLLGLGQDASPEGRTLGTQLSLFDVSDAGAPRLLHQRGLGSSTWSEAEYDHHAFLWWAPRGLAVVPVSDWERDDPAQAIGFRVDREGGIAPAGATTESHPVLRTLVVAGRLFALTAAGLRAYDLETLAPGPFARF